MSLTKAGNDKDHLVWAAEPLRMLYVCDINEKLITSTQSIKMSKEVRISNEILRRETCFRDIIQVVLNCLQVFEKHYMVSYVEAHTLNIFDGKML